jgi:hypothetical protein
MHPLWWGVAAADTSEELDAVSAAGVSLVRVDLSWAALEPQPGEYATWLVDQTDDFMQQAAARGIKVILTFWGTPCWASSAPDALRGDCTGDYFAVGVDRYPPTDPSLFADAASWVVDRWGSDLAALEVWNEPNNSVFFNSSTPALAYTRILEATYTLVHAENPALPILGGALAGADTAFLAELYQAGAGPYMDAVSIHPYDPGLAPDASGPTPSTEFVGGIDAVRDVMVEAGYASESIWITEFGWSTCGSPGGCVSEDTQAEYLSEALSDVAKRPYVAAAVIYQLRDDPTGASVWDDNYGLLDADFAPKPAYAALAEAEQASTAGGGALQAVSGAPGPVPSTPSDQETAPVAPTPTLVPPDTSLSASGVGLPSSSVETAATPNTSGPSSSVAPTSKPTRRVSRPPAARHARARGKPSRRVSRRRRPRSRHAEPRVRDCIQVPASTCKRA